MDTTVVQEEVDLLLSTCVSHLFEEALELVLVEAVIFNSKGKQFVARTDCSTDSLTWLVASSVLYVHSLSWARPCRHLKASGFEHTLISKDEMTSFLEYLPYVLI